MLISVIVPLYKGAKYINRIINLVERSINIDYSNIEIIFVNDYPNDFFEKENYPAKINMKFVNHEKNKGIHRTKIDGFKKAKGEFLLFLDQDDTITECFFDSQLNKIGEYDAVFCNGYHRQSEEIYDSEEQNCNGFDLKNYMLTGYPLISLGQMLIRREAIPGGWIENPLINNGWDDHLFWVCMMHEGASVIYNNNFLYIHEEDGDNASFNWTEMKKSGNEFMKNLCKQNIFDKEAEEKFIQTINRRLQKYDKYIELDELLKNINHDKLKEYLHKYSIHTVAIYGIGVYGRKLCKILRSKNIHIIYGIDRKCTKKKDEFPIYANVREDIPVDCIFCATGFDDENIKKGLNCACKIITMQNFLLEIG